MDYPSRNIRFTSTEDAVDIAFWEIGEGKPVVIIQNFGISHAELEWGVPSLASFYMEMAEQYRVIRFDPRGWVCRASRLEDGVPSPSQGRNKGCLPMRWVWTYPLLPLLSYSTVSL